MPDRPTLQEVLLRKASSIGADTGPYGTKKVMGTPIMVGPIGAAGAMGAGFLENQIPNNIQDPKIWNKLTEYTLDNMKGYGARKIGDFMLHQFEDQTGAHLPRSLGEAYNLIRNKDR